MPDLAPRDTPSIARQLPSRVRRMLRRALRAGHRSVARAVKHSIRLGERVIAAAGRRRRSVGRELGRARIVAVRAAATVWTACRAAGLLARYGPPEELIACPACGASPVVLLAPMPLNDRPAGSRFGFVSGCRACGIVFANPQPAPEVLSAFYSPDGEWGDARAREERQEKAPATGYLLALFDAVRDWVDVAHPPTGGRVLDVGSGGGEMLDFFRQFGWETYGVDPGDKRAFSRHRELAAIPVDGRFELAILHHVLEHVGSPLALLRTLRAALVPGGVLFISVPRLDTVALHRDFRYCINSRTHIVAFTAVALQGLLARAGFESVVVSPAPVGEAAARYSLKRLRVMARVTDAPVPAPEHPLAAARAALAAYEAVAPREPLARWLPVRARAALADRARGRREPREP